MQLSVSIKNKKKLPYNVSFLIALKVVILNLNEGIDLRKILKISENFWILVLGELYLNVWKMFS